MSEVSVHPAWGFSYLGVHPLWIKDLIPNLRVNLIFQIILYCSSLYRIVSWFTRENLHDICSYKYIPSIQGERGFKVEWDLFRLKNKHRMDIPFLLIKKLILRLYNFCFNLAEDCGEKERGGDQQEKGRQAVG